MGHPKMRWSIRVAVVLLLSAAVEAVVTSGASSKEDKEGPPGLVELQNVDDLVAEASVETQKREIPAGGLSNSYGEPIPADSYGPPPVDDGKHSAHLIAPTGISDSYGPPIKQDLGLPIPVYGVPDDPSNHVKYPEPPPDIPPPITASGPSFGGIPHETYGPPKVNFAHIHHSGRPEIVNGHKITISGSQQYHGPPPPPQYGPPPKPQYGPPPKPQYGPPPKLQYGPPKLQYGPPKINIGIPKPALGPPKPQYGPPKHHYGPPPHPPKHQYGPPPKPQYGPPKVQYGPPKFQALPRPPKVQFSSKPVFLQKPHPVYGPPIAHVEQHVLKPAFPVPEDTYGPPGKPIGHGDLFSQQLSSNDQIFGPPIGIHHGPPEPDPDPKPAHPGIPAPPTPPHILYDGWTPIPGLVSKPPQNVHDHFGPPPVEGSFISTLHSTGSGGGSSGVFGVPAATYGVPAQSLDIHSIGGHSNNFISSGYSSVAANEGLQGIDLNSIIGSNHGDEGIGLQGSKTVFEAHYTEGSSGGGDLGGHGGHNSFSVVKGLGFDASGGDSHGGNFQLPGPRQLGQDDIGLKPPSGVYGVPPGGKYGIPPPPPPHNSHLAISYGVPSGSVGTGSINPLGHGPPKRPISFREPVPQGLIETIGQSVIQKDSFGIDHSHGQHAYLPPPVQELPEREPEPFLNDISHGATFSVQASIEPTNLYSLPSVGSPINFNGGSSHSQVSASAYSSSVDSYHAPLSLTDTYGAPSIKSSVTTTLDGKQVVNVVEASEDVETSTIGTDAASLAAAILKNCPYHKALYEAAKNVEQNNAIASDSDSASETSNTFKILPPNTNLIIESDKQKDAQKGKSLVESGEGQFIQLSQNGQGFQPSVVFQALPQVHEQVEHQQFLGPNYEVLNGVHHIPVQGNLGSYTLQIQSADGLGQTQQSDSVPHDQVLSEGLLQSILQAIEQPHQTQIIPQVQIPSVPVVHQTQFLDLSQAPSGLVLPDGYEIQPKAFAVQEQNNEQPKHPSRGDQEAEDIEPVGSESERVIVVSPQNSKDKISSKSFLEQFGFISKRVNEKEPEIVTPLNIIDDNEIAVYFNSDKNEVDFDKDKSKDDKYEVDDEENEDEDEEKTTETVTEISVETSISASEEDSLRNAQQYGDGETKKGKYGDKIGKKAEAKTDESS